MEGEGGGGVDTFPHVGVAGTWIVNLDSVVKY